MPCASSSSTHLSLSSFWCSVSPSRSELACQEGAGVDRAFAVQGSCLMDCRAQLRRTPLAEALLAAKPRGCVSAFARVGVGYGGRWSGCSIGGSVSFQGNAWFHEKQSRSIHSEKTRKLSVKAANAESNKCEYNRYVGSPLEPHSEAGKFLSSVLRNQPHVFHVAVAKQLEELALDRDSAVARRERSLDASEAFLHGKIAEMKELECQSAIEEVMYMLIVQNFSKIKAPMVQRLSKYTCSGTLEIWPPKDLELESIHSPEVLELIKEHLSLILNREGRYDCSSKWCTAQIRKLQLGRLYAASIIYGYFLKSASLRHQLEHCLARTDLDYPLGCTICVPHLERQMSNLEDHPVVVGKPYDPVSLLSPGLNRYRKPKKLRTYVMDFDSKAIQLCAMLRSREAVNLIENHSLAIFGDGDLSTLESNEMVVVTFAALKRLIMEAVAFGTFLWDAEAYVDSIYKLKEN